MTRSDLQRSKALRKLLVITALLAVWLAAGSAARAETTAHFTLYTAKGTFAEVRQDLADAITNRGFVIDRTSYIGRMLDRTAKAVGAKKRVYAKAQAMQFCSATYSRKTMEADATNILFCPYVVVVYALASDPATVYVGYRRLPAAGSPQSRKALKAVDDLLHKIVREAAGLP